MDERFQRHVESDVRNAIRTLANAAATREAGRARGVLLGDCEYLWFIVRALCHEHDMDSAGVVERARNIAAERVQRMEGAHESP